MKKLLFAGMAAVMLAACSNDEVVQVNNDANAIKFGVTAENGTRAADIYCNNNPFDNFYVSAAYNGVAYFEGDYISNVGTSSSPTWDNQTGIRYWPSSGEVTFFGYKNYDLTFDATAPTFTGFQVKQDVGSQEDLMYARTTQERNGTSESVNQVTLNFRHALSQIVFNAKNVDPSIYVEIEEIAVANVYDKGTYTFPEEDTNVTLNHPSASEDYQSSRGEWEISKDSHEAEYRVKVYGENNIAKLNGVKGNTVKTNLTDWDLKDAEDYDADNVHESASDKSKAMLLLPSKKADYDADGKTKSQLPHFLVKCRIYNVSDVNATDKTDNVMLWGASSEGKDVLIPFDPNWDEGKKYTYTFVFGNGNGGYDPENPENPVLVPITFDVDIDEFKDAGIQPDVEMKTK